MISGVIEMRGGSGCGPRRSPSCALIQLIEQRGRVVALIDVEEVETNRLAVALPQPSYPLGEGATRSRLAARSPFQQRARLDDNCVEIGRSRRAERVRHVVERRLIRRACNEHDGLTAGRDHLISYPFEVLARFW